MQKQNQKNEILASLYNTMSKGNFVQDGLPAEFEKNTFQEVTYFIRVNSLQGAGENLIEYLKNNWDFEKDCLSDQNLVIIKSLAGLVNVMEYRKRLEF